MNTTHRKLETRAKKLGISDHTKFLGFVNGEELRELYQACSVNLFSATNQSWGLTPFEALCAEKVSIVTSDCGAAEVIAENSIGIVADPNPEGFATRILDIYKHPDTFREMARRGKDYVKEHLNHQVFAKGIIGLCRVVCEIS